MKVKNKDQTQNQMKEQNRKRMSFLTAFAITVVALLGVIMGAVIVIDPFFQYHKPLKGFPYVIDNQLSQNPGMAKNFEYDAILLGSSMTVNFDTDWFMELTGERVAKLSYNGAYPKDQDNILKIVMKRHPDLKKVYLGIDIPAYTADPQQTKFAVPSELYDDNIVNDVTYWFNKDVLLNYIVKPMVEKNAKTSVPTMYALNYRENDYGVEQVLFQYTLPEPKDEEVEKYHFVPYLEENLKQNICPYIEQYPDTTFTIFFPPFSILYWNNIKIENKLEATLEEYQYACERLLSYDNVNLYMFSDEADIICDLTNYADYTHYHPRVNRYMAEVFATQDASATQKRHTGKMHLVTKENLPRRIEKMRAYGSHFSMDKLYSGEVLTMFNE